MKHLISPNGAFSLDLPWQFAWVRASVVGGPYDIFSRIRTDDLFGVCVRAERIHGLHIDAHLPVEDFSVPADRKKVESVLKAAVSAILDGKTLYVGCMGGIGRTGLFMALLLKVFGFDDPVHEVRARYMPEAVETSAQKKFVADFDVSGIRSWAMRESWRRKVLKWFRFRK